MHKFDIVSFLKDRRSVFRFILCWSAGLAVGTFLAVCMNPDISLRMRLASSCQVSIPGLLTVIVLPFLLSAYAVTVSKPGFILLICFFKALSLSLIGAMIYIAFGSAGWLIRFLLQFTNIFAAPVFCWFAIRHLSGSSVEAVRRDLRVGLLISAVAASVDYFMISPFLVRLMDL